MHRLAILVLSLLSLTAIPVHAADRKFDPAAAAKAVAPFLDDRTVVVLQVDLTRVDVEMLFKQLAELMGIKPNELADQKKSASDTVKKLTAAGAKDLFVVISLADVPQGPPFLVVPLEKGADAKALVGVLKSFDPQSDAEPIGSAVVAGTAATRTRLKTLKPVALPELAKAFTAVGDGLGHAVLLASANVRKEIEEGLPKLPPELGGGSIKTLTKGLQWMALKVETSPKVQISWITQAADKDAAKVLNELTLKAKKSFLEQKNIRELGPNIEKILDGFTPRLDGDRLLLTLDEMYVARLLGAVQGVRNAAALMQLQNNMKQLGLAFANIAGTTTTGDLLAVANFDKTGKPLLSWRVHILPYLDEGDLYKQFHLDEPWDSEHNKKLIAKIPKTFVNPLNPKLAAEGKTTILAPVHKEAIFTGEKKPIRYPADIPDGPSATILLVDVEDDAAVIWTKPDDLKLDPKEPHKHLAIRGGERFVLLLADGAMRLFPKKIDKATLWAAFTRNGGEKVNLP